MKVEQKQESSSEEESEYYYDEEDEEEEEEKCGMSFNNVGAPDKRLIVPEEDKTNAEH